MATKTLTETKVKQAKPGPKAIKHFDGGGLYLEVSPSGGKLWRYKYRIDGKEKRLALGTYPEISLADARKRHQDARDLLAHGQDPGVRKADTKQRAEKASADTFDVWAAKWLQFWRQGKSERHAGYVERRLEADILPELGHLPIAGIVAPDIVRTVTKISDRGNADLAKRAHQVISQILRYAVAHGAAIRNPARDFMPGDVIPSKPKENYARLDARELPAFLKAVAVAETSVLTRAAHELLSLTFVRTSELIGAEWSEFDGTQWRIPAERMKMKSPHIVPLSAQALKVVATIRAYHAAHGIKSAHLFPSQSKAASSSSPTMSNNTLLKLIERAGYQHRMTGHGWRGLASTVLHEKNFEHSHIELQLAHQERNAVSASYNHATYLDQRAAMMQWWADYLDTQRT